MSGEICPRGECPTRCDMHQRCSILQLLRHPSRLIDIKQRHRSRVYYAPPSRVICPLNSLRVARLMPMTHIPEIGAKNQNHKPARKQNIVLFVTRNWFQKKNLVLSCMSDAPETGTGVLVPVFCADFWYVCHWRNETAPERTSAVTRWGLWYVIPDIEVWHSVCKKPKTSEKKYYVTFQFLNACSMQDTARSASTTIACATTASSENSAWKPCAKSGTSAPLWHRLFIYKSILSLTQSLWYDTLCLTCRKNCQLSLPDGIKQKN